jgi:ferrous iron transport protein A
VIVTSLREVAIGSTAEVELVTGSDSTSERLLEMGITPGVRVRVVGAAPLGCPLELEVRGYRLSIRRTDAARVAVFPSAEPRSMRACSAPLRRPLPR